MRTTEKTLFILCVMSIGLALALVPGGVIFTFASVTLLGLLYLLFGFLLFNDIRLRDMFRAASYRGISAMHIIGAVVAGIIMQYTLWAFTFLFLGWNGSLLVALVALIACAVIAIICLIKILDKGDAYYKGIVARIIVAAASCILLLAIPQRTFRMFMHRNHPAYIRAAEEARQHPNDTTLQRKEHEAYEQMFHH